MLTALVIGHWSLLFLIATACGNPRVNPPENNTAESDSGEEVERPASAPVRLRPQHKPGDRFRTSRTLRVEELTETERYLTESEEVTLTEVQRVDESGRLLSVRRTWESSVTRLAKGYRRGEEARGELDGCTLEMTQRANGVDARVLVGDVSVRGRNLLIEGFDVGLLPLDPVKESDYWELEGNRLSGLNGFIEAMQFEIEKNKLTCQLIDLKPAMAVISLEWRITGSFANRPAVLEFFGELTFDRKTNLITRFELSGGRQTDDGPKQQIDIEVTRRPVKGWLDLER